MGPPIALFAAIVVLPTAMALRLSFTDASLLGQSNEWIGLANFTEAFTNEHVRKSIRITLVWTLFRRVDPAGAGAGRRHGPPGQQPLRGRS